jgi:sugar transferase EpsL
MQVFPNDGPQLALPVAEEIVVSPGDQALMAFMEHLQSIVKRCMDISGAAVLLLALTPVLSIICLTILVMMGRPIFFRQLRAGKHSMPFTLVKFRTMANDNVDNDRAISDEDARRRLTKLGLFLRAWSLDELPQLWNVLKGDMSLVGPRPLLMVYVPRYTARQARRHEVKPGITGWAQIQGRNAINWEDKFERDVWYVENQSLRLDLRILCLTLLKVVRREGIQNANAATMPEFVGSKTDSLN